MSKSEKIRDSNFELLRIICMLLIIAGHLTKQSGILLQSKYYRVSIIDFIRRNSLDKFIVSSKIYENIEYKIMSFYKEIV